MFNLQTTQSEQNRHPDLVCPCDSELHHHPYCHEYQNEVKQGVDRIPTSQQYLAVETVASDERVPSIGDWLAKK